MIALGVVSECKGVPKIPEPAQEIVKMLHNCLAKFDNVKSFVSMSKKIHSFRAFDRFN